MKIQITEKNVWYSFLLSIPNQIKSYVLYYNEGMLYGIYSDNVILVKYNLPIISDSIEDKFNIGIEKDSELTKLLKDVLKKKTSEITVEEDIEQVKFIIKRTKKSEESLEFFGDLEEKFEIANKYYSIFDLLVKTEELSFEELNIMDMDSFKSIVNQEDISKENIEVIKLFDRLYDKKYLNIIYKILNQNDRLFINKAKDNFSSNFFNLNNTINIYLNELVPVK